MRYYICNTKQVPKHMKKCLLLAAGILLFHTSYSQYFYQDIHNTRQAVANMELLKDRQVKTQIVQSLDANQETDNDFRCERALNPTYRQMRAYTQSRATGFSVMTSTFSGKGQLTKTSDNTESSVSTVQYRYDAEGRLVFISSSSQSRNLTPNNRLRFEETRAYHYDSTGRLIQMIHRKGNDRDSSIVRFTTDSSGHVTEEVEEGTHVRPQRFYYRYDAQGRLTDVVRYHPARKRMLPDYMFEYDAQGRLSQMTTVNAEQATYTIWKYEYLQNGLPAKETCYGKGRELLGMVKYGYEMNK